MTRPSRQKWLLVLVGILLVTNIITLTVFFWTSRSQEEAATPPPKPRMGKFIVDEMQFDSTQEAAYWEMRDSLMEAQKPVWDSIRAAKKRFFDLVNYTDVNDALLQARINEVLAHQKKLDIITFHHFQQVRTLCRPDQMQKFDTVIKEIVNRMTSFRRPGRNAAGDSTLKK